jgi:hypothetical protein
MLLLGSMLFSLWSRSLRVWVYLEEAYLFLPHPNVYSFSIL